MIVRILEEYNFINEHTPKAEENFKEWITKHPPTNQNDITDFEKFDLYLDDVYNALNEFCQNLGYNVINRLPKYNQIHLLLPENYQKISEYLHGDNPYSAGITIPLHRDVFIKFVRANSIFDTMTATQHELIHKIASKNVYLGPDPQNFLVLSGYGIPHTYVDLKFNEGLTEMINQYIVVNYWHNYPQLKIFRPQIYDETYQKNVEKIKGVISKISKDNNVEYNEVFLNLVRGFIEGNKNFIKDYDTEDLFSVKF